MLIASLVFGFGQQSAAFAGRHTHTIPHTKKYWPSWTLWQVSTHLGQPPSQMKVGLQKTCFAHEDEGIWAKRWCVRHFGHIRTELKPAGFTQKGVQVERQGSQVPDQPALSASQKIETCSGTLHLDFDWDKHPQKNRQWSMQCHRLTGPCFVTSTYFQMFLP